MDKETPTTVKKVNADGSIDLVAAIGLKDGDTLGVAKSATSVTSLATALTVDNASPFQVADLIGVGATPQSNFAILRAIDGSNLDSGVNDNRSAHGSRRQCRFPRPFDRAGRL